MSRPSLGWLRRWTSVYVSFYDQGNLGDDLMFLFMARRYPDTTFRYLDEGGGSASLFAAEPNVSRWVLPRYLDGVLRRLRLPLSVIPAARRAAIRTAQYSVRVGGSLYMERGPWRKHATDDEGLLRSREGALFLNGNFGPWRTVEFLNRYAGLFAKSIDVTVRDSESLRQFATVPTVRLAPDMLLALDPPPVSAPRSGVVVSVIDLTGRLDLADRREAYEQRIAWLVEDLVVTGREHVALMSFCAAEGDEAAIDRVLALLPPEVRSAVGTHTYRGDAQAALTVLAGAERIIATRFHAMILGLAFGCRVACIAYSDKVTTALDDLGLGSLGWSMERFVTSERREVYRAMMGPAEDLPANSRAEALGHFEVLDRRLARKIAPA